MIAALETFHSLPTFRKGKEGKVSTFCGKSINCESIRCHKSPIMWKARKIIGPRRDGIEA